MVTMHFESPSRRAFELVTEALREIDGYRASKERSRLQTAQEKLQRALQVDPGFFRASYYDAIVTDLAGKAKDAAAHLELLLQQNPPFDDEVRYNLGVAYYHQYSRRHLDTAIGHFKRVIEDTKDRSLRLLAGAVLAQAYAMRTIQPEPDKPDLKDAELNATNAFKQSDLVEGELKALKSTLDPASQTEVAWTVRNARGMALMYFTDYLPIEGQEQKRTAEKLTKLERAIKELGEADKLSPRNWANYCDLGSAYMRKAFYRGSQEDFGRGAAYLLTVVSDLRPNYGFALYELGRLHRLKGDFDKALEYFARALDVREHRDVSDSRVEREIRLAKEASKKYP